MASRAGSSQTTRRCRVAGLCLALAAPALQAATIAEQLATMAADVTTGPAQLAAVVQRLPPGASDRERLDAWRGLYVAGLWSDAGLATALPSQTLADGLLPQAQALAERLGDRATLSVLQVYEATRDYWAHLRAYDRWDRLDAALEQARGSGDGDALCLALVRRGEAGWMTFATPQWAPYVMQAASLEQASPVCRAYATSAALSLNAYLSGLTPVGAERGIADGRKAAESIAGRNLGSLEDRLVVGQAYMAAMQSSVQASAGGPAALPDLEPILERARRKQDSAMVMAASVFRGIAAMSAGDSRRALASAEEAASQRVGPVGRASALGWAISLATNSQAAALPAVQAWADELKRMDSDTTPLRMRLIVHEPLRDWYAAKGDFRQAFESSRALTYLMAQASLMEQGAALQKLQVEFDTRGKELDNARLRASQAELVARRNLLGLGLLATVAVLGALLLLYRRQVQQKRRLAELYGQLESLNASRSAFLAAACHDLRQPAHSLELLAEVAAGDARPDAAVVQDIRRNSNMLGDMLSSLLDMAQLESAQPQVNLQPVSLDALFDEAALQFKAQAARKGLAFERSGRGLWVRSDPQLLRRIVFNLVGNACKYTVRGAVQLEMAPGADASVQLRVRDTGPGIPKDRIPDMLRPYTRMDHGAKEQGLGLGLSVVQRAAQALGHALRIDSTVGGGTTVTVELPRSDAPTSVVDALAGADASGPEGPDSAATPAARPALVAVLEDNDEVRAALLRLLARWNLRTVDAATGDGLLAQLAGDGAPVVPDLLLVDHDLGPEDGIEVTRAIRARPGLGGLRAVLVTGSIDTDTERLAHDAGMTVLLKPTRPSVLRRTLDRELAAAREPALHQ